MEQIQANSQEKKINLEDFKLGMVNAMGDILTKEFSKNIGDMSMPEIMGWVNENCTDEKLSIYKNLVTNTILRLQNEIEGQPATYFNQRLPIGDIQELFDITLETYGGSIRNQIKNKTNRARHVRNGVE